jgi:hypothetical protein
MRYVLAVLLFSLSLSAQTTTPKKVAVPKSKALIACEARADLAFGVSDELAARNVELEAKNEALQKK